MQAFSVHGTASGPAIRLTEKSLVFMIYFPFFILISFAYDFP